MSSVTGPSDTARGRAMWMACLASAYRTGLACAIVGCATLYGQARLQRLVAYPAFSYATVILIVTDATFGDAIRGCWLALYATIQSVCPAILVFWVVQPVRFSAATTALSVALASLLVLLPGESTHLVAKRIGLGQIVIVYVVGFINGVHTEALMHLVGVAASTALGALACVVATLVPLPKLACSEARQNCLLLGANSTKRLDLFVQALSAEEKAVALSSISQAKSMSTAAIKLLQGISRSQRSAKWERFLFMFSRRSTSSEMDVADQLHDVNISLNGMELALTSIPSFPVSVLNGELIDGLNSFVKHIGKILEQCRGCSLCDSSTFPPEDGMKSLRWPASVPTTDKDLPHFFFIFCVKLLRRRLLTGTSTEPHANTEKNENSDVPDKRMGFSFKWVLTGLAPKVAARRLMPAFKCSISLGLAALFGLIYSKENGFWAALPVAISLAADREATFKVANVKVQGTVLGSVYGVLGCFLFERFLAVRFLSLLPWFVFTSFLQRSRMYGQAGGISAVIGAVLVLGRKDFGLPSEFAVARIVETFIGLSCSTTVDLLFQPRRAATLAKIQLSKSLGTLHDCVNSQGFQVKISELGDNLYRLKMEVTQLGRFIDEAEMEPNFWFSPFLGRCYGKLFNSLNKMADILSFSAHAAGHLEQLRLSQKALSKKAVHELDEDLGHFKKMVSFPIKSFERVSRMKSISALEEQAGKNNVSYDLELVKSQGHQSTFLSGLDEGETNRFLFTFLQHSREVVDGEFQASEGEESKSEIALSLSSLAFVLSGLVKETRVMEELIKELVQGENPSSHVDLNQIAGMIQALENSSCRKNI